MQANEQQYKLYGEVYKKKFDIQIQRTKCQNNIIQIKYNKLKEK